MKKRYFYLSFVLALTLLFSVMVGGCKKLQVTTTDDYVLFTATQDVTTIDEKTSVKDYLDALVAQGAVTIEGTTSEYGFYLTAVNGKASTTAEDGHSGYSWMIYTDLVTLDGVTYSSADYGTYSVGDKAYNSASVGLSYLPCVEGYTYLLVYSAWSY